MILRPAFLGAESEEGFVSLMPKSDAREFRTIEGTPPNAGFFIHAGEVVKTWPKSSEVRRNAGRLPPVGTA